MWFVFPLIIGLTTYALSEEYPFLKWAILLVMGGTVFVSAIGTPAAGASYFFLAVLIILGILLLRYIIPITLYIIGGLIGLMFFYYLIVGLGQLVEQLP